MDLSYLKWVNARLAAECENCIFLQICQGGCMAGQNGKHPVKCFLQKEIMDYLLLDYIERI